MLELCFTKIYEHQFLGSHTKHLQFLENLWKNITFHSVYFLWSLISLGNQMKTDHSQVSLGYYLVDMELPPCSHSPKAMLSGHKAKRLKYTTIILAHEKRLANAVKPGWCGGEKCAVVQLWNTATAAWKRVASSNTTSCFFT